jgi:signal transduction histidine kinase
MQVERHSKSRDIDGEVGRLAVLARLVRQRTAAVRRLSAQLLRAQEEERRRLARELHDSTGQTLTALKLELAALQSRMQGPDFVVESLVQAISLTEQAVREIRTRSYLLYPPLLDEVGLCSAARWYVERFAKRSRIQVHVHLASIGRLSRAMEIALFRILQESLTNVYRHSTSNTAEVRLESAKQSVTLEVRDYGKGIPSNLLDQFRNEGSGSGVGLAGMRERIQELGGSLVIISDEAGTLVRATVPADLKSAPAGEIGAC